MNTFKVVFSKDEVEDIIAYNNIMNYIQREHNEEDGTLWKFRRIVVLSFGFTLIPIIYTHVPSYVRME